TSDFILTNLFWYGIMYGAWRLVQHLTPLHLDKANPLVWLLAFGLSDLSYYLYHRTSHRMRLLWAVHAVHHTSHNYNLSTALRLSSLEGLIRWPFWLILPAIGVPAPLTMTAYLFVRVYQVPLHTTYVGRLGFFERLFLTTPSIHRVHHGRNPQYIDKNYGGVTTIWDHLFGTYEPEVEIVDYGTVPPLNSDNPLIITFGEFVSLGRDIAATPRLLDKLRYPFMPPGWRPKTLAAPISAAA
ncbi:MAG TPA: sterol desaturase family protein, partial [Caulobacteraceae bacterium]|nr:sterol desaturase family protein [Caulobacteraceae bacterium]